MIYLKINDEIKMRYYNKACEECILNGECLFQDMNDVESYDDVLNYRE